MSCVLCPVPRLDSLVCSQVCMSPLCGAESVVGRVTTSFLGTQLYGGEGMQSHPHPCAETCHRRCIAPCNSASRLSAQAPVAVSCGLHAVRAAQGVLWQLCPACAAHCVYCGVWCSAPRPAGIACRPHDMAAAAVHSPLPPLALLTHQPYAQAAAAVDAGPTSL